MSINLKISISGVRGVIGESLTPELVSDFAASFGQYVGGGRVVVGRDTRPTGPMIEKSVISGLISAGCRPILLGIVPTPTVQIAVDKLRAKGGIVISASHNPVEWNALKFIGSSGIFLNHTEAAELLDIYNQPGASYVSENEMKEVQFSGGAFDEHRERIFRNVDTGLIRKKRFRIAIDCCNGAGAFYAPDFLRELGCEVFPIFTETDGVFRRNPEPVKKNLEALAKTIRENNCIAGFAQDPDADRLTVLDSKGETIGGQYTLALAIAHVLSKNKGTVVVNLDTTKTIEKITEKAGVKLLRSKIGEINVVADMIAHDAVIGGEGGSGGIIWPAVHPCRDSFAGMALILEMMASLDQNLEEILKSFPKYHMIRKEVPCSGASAAQLILRTLRKKYESMNPDTRDGLKIEWEDSWVLVRPSNTEPLIRISAEAPTLKEAEKIAAEFAETIAEINRI